MASKDWLRLEFRDYKLLRVRCRAARPGDDGGDGAAGPAGRSPSQLAVLVLVPILMVCVTAGAWLLWTGGAGLGQGNLVVARTKGTVRASDDLKDWDLTVGARLTPGHRIFCGKDSAVELKGGDPDTRLVVFENGSFYLESLKLAKANSANNSKAFLLKGKVEKGDVLFDFRSETAFWGVEAKVPQGTRFLAQNVIMFKVTAGEDKSRLVVGDGVVAAMGPASEKEFVRAEQQMITSHDAVVSKPTGINVFSVGWNF